MDHVSCKKIHNLKLQREGNDPFGFRIIGGVDQGKTFQVDYIFIKYYYFHPKFI